MWLHAQDLHALRLRQGAELAIGQIPPRQSQQRPRARSSDADISAAPPTVRLGRSPMVRAVANSAITGCQPLLRAGCLNSRIVGYHGLSVRSRSQRQSGEALSATHVGRASAPARCAIEVSEVMMRSRLAMIAAVSRKASGPRSSSSPRSSTRSRNGTSRSCSAPGPFCKETRLTPGISASGANAVQRDGATPCPDQALDLLRVALPGDANTQAGELPQPRRPMRQSLAGHRRNR